MLLMNHLQTNSGNDSGTNPGNNLHVSGLAHRVDNRELDSLFSKYGKVSFYTAYEWYYC